MKELQIGDSAAISIVAADETVRKIAAVSGDVNPVHLDDAYAENTVFKKRIAHGLFCVNGVSRVLGTMLPGEGTILLSQTFRYLAPVYIDDRVEIRVCVKDKRQDKDIYSLDITCTNQHGQIVMEGESVVKWKN